MWDELGPKLNDIYTYSQRIGNWKRLKAAGVVQLKRDCDRIFYSYEPIWSVGSSKSYQEFIESVFETCTEAGEDARIKSSPIGRDENEPYRFASDYSEVFENPEAKAAYRDLIAAASDALALREPGVGARTSRPPYPARRSPRRRSPVRRRLAA